MFSGFIIPKKRVVSDFFKNIFLIHPYNERNKLRWCDFVYIKATLRPSHQNFSKPLTSMEDFLF